MVVVVFGPSLTKVVTTMKLESATLYPPYGQKQDHSFSFLFQLPFFCRFSQEKVALVWGKGGFSFWFQLGHLCLL